MLLIYTHKPSPRIKYIFKLILEDLLGISFTITHNKNEFTYSLFPKINYSSEQFIDSFHIKPAELLFEKGINTNEIPVSKWNELPVLYPVKATASFPFDIFAASFYLISRYEEYLPYNGDKFKRFEASESIASKNGFLILPVINLWTQIFAQALKIKYPAISFQFPQYKYIPTIDIDIAYAYRHKGFLRTSGGFIKSFYKFDFNDNIKRMKVLLGLVPDPFDTYSYINKLHSEYSLAPIFFILFAGYGKFDKNINTTNRHFLNLIRALARNGVIGIHPSYASSNDNYFINKEVSALEKVIDRKIFQSRQHFLKLSFPFTYRSLIEAGITEDYSMGYASACGFRAGICTPFMFYDLLAEQETHLKIFPFPAMDSALNYYMRFSPDATLEIMEQIIKIIKKVNGTFVSLWHNDSLSDKNHWKGWRTVYEKMIILAIS